MALQIPYPVTPLKSTSSQDLSIHLNERVNAQVLNVTGTQAILEINGYPVVARLTSKEQAAELSSRKAAEFIITHLSKDEITLKLAVKVEAMEPGLVQAPLRDPAPDISAWLGLEGTREELYLIRAALRENLALTGETAGQLLDAVKGSGLDQAEGIDLAVRLKAAGLPVSADSLKIAGKFPDIELAGVLGEMVKDLQAILARVPRGSTLTGEIQQVLSQLKQMIPDLSGSQEQLNTALQKLFRFLGKPYERLIHEELAGDKAQKSALNLLDLLQLGKSLRESGLTRAAEEIDRFLDQVRQNQFMNIKPNSSPGKGTWSEVNFVVQWQNTRSDQTTNARAKISYRQDKNPQVIDPRFTSLILQVDLEPAKEVTFNLSLFQNKVTAEILSSDYQVMQMYKEALPEFDDLLSQLEYSVVQASVHLCALPKSDGFGSATWLDLENMNVNIVV